MHHAIDRRAARTRKALHKALMTLILRKGYEDITVQDLLDEADIGRSTFYAHYTGKEDLLRRGFEGLRAAMTEIRGGKEGDPLAFSLGLFRHVADYAHIFRALVGGRGGAVATQEIRRILLELVKAELPEKPGEDRLDQDFRRHFIADAFFTTLNWWLEKTPPLPPEQVDALFRRLLFEGIAR